MRDGCVRWCQNTEYLEAADTKPFRKLTGISLRSLADAIRAEQDILKTSKKTLPAWGLPLLFLGHEPMALITIGTLFNMIARSEFETCLPPRITPVAHEIGQLCRIERLADLAKHRAVDVAEVIGMHTFGASAPLKELQRKFGFEPGQVAAAAKDQLRKNH